MKQLAVIETGGKQYLILPEREIKIEKIKGVSENEEIVFDKVLLIASWEGDKKEPKVIIGKPYIEGAVVKGQVTQAGRGKKIIVFHYRPKTRYRKKRGHRQPFLKVQPKEIKK